MRINLSKKELVDIAVERGEGVIAANGAFCAETGARTGRSPNDRFIVDDDTTHEAVAWGKVNRPISTEKFDALWARAEAYLEGKEIFVSDLQVGACDQHATQVRVMTEYAWHNVFTQNLFMATEKVFDPMTSWTLLSVPGLQTDPERDGVNSDATLMINFTERRVLGCGLRYAGEMKKSMFGVMNFMMPAADVLPMHCAANQGEDGNVALFFGLSGTGKTTLSADPTRYLIGDDEHGWSKTGVFNFEGGCYAKCIDLSREREPVIYDAIRAEAIMENVVLNEAGEPDYTDDRLTQNSRSGYPREFIEKRVPSNQGGHPHAVLFLTCDLYGVLPPVSKLTKEQAAYHFLSGYTALVGSTEVGQGAGVKSTFSACFGAPFFPRATQVYADLLMKRIEETGAEVFLVNTGWTGGAYGKGGERFSIPTTRAVVSAITEGRLKNVEWTSLPGFSLAIPVAIEGVDTQLLDPRVTWSSRDAYNETANVLIEKFQENFKQFSVTDNIASAGPMLL